VNPALELVNSEWWRGRPGGAVDQLEDDEWVASYAERAGLGELPPLASRDRRALKALRATLRALVERAPGVALADLDAYVAAAPVRRRVVATSLVAEPVVRDWRWARAEIAASFVALVSGGEPDRIKICANHECQWTFYDASKNRSRRWCGAASCGTADKVRRFRARRASARRE
jgi:predicted RNA-binding Zn ribbon-like protein